MLRGGRIEGCCPACRAGEPGAILGAHADVAQLVEHHLAKVRVAGSNPVVRSKSSELPLLRWFAVPGHRGLDERLERAGVELLAFVDVDRAPHVALQAGVEQA